MSEFTVRGDRVEDVDVLTCLVTNMKGFDIPLFRAKESVGPDLARLRRS